MPSELMERYSRVAHITSRILPSTDEAIRSYRQSGGRLTMPDINRFSRDPLGASDHRRQRRETLYFERFPDSFALFSSIVNGNARPFKDAVLYCIQLTRRL